MTQETPIEVDVFVAGAGPTGLAAANEAMRHGLTVHIKESPPTTVSGGSLLQVTQRIYIALSGDKV